MITLKNVTKQYGAGEAAVQALRGIDLTIEEGELVAVTGKSGSGKSTLLNILGGLDTVSGGAYFFRGQKLLLDNQKRLAAFRRDHIGLILQYFALIEDICVADNIVLPLRYGKVPKGEREHRVEVLAKRLGIAEKLSRYPGELSGGQRQRVAIARALIRSPEVILADEPTGALDSETGRDILRIFKELHQSGATMVLVTHDDGIAAACERRIRLVDGQIEQE